MDLENKVALITGSAKRIGKAVALALAEQGCNVIIHYGQSAEAAQQTITELKSIGVEAWLIAADLSNETALSAYGRNSSCRWGNAFGLS